MVSSIISRLVILVFGTLYPAYASYKAVKTKNVKEYVKWMMYWIVFALFTCLETIADIFISFWLPFYYELKILFVLWLMSPATKGSSILYRKFVHPAFTRRERDIDDYISKAKEQGYSTVLQMGSKGFSYATSVVMQTALRVSCNYGPFINKLQGALADALFQLFHPDVNTSCSNADTYAEFALDKQSINEISKYPFNNDLTNGIELPCHENQAFSHSDTSIHLSQWYSSVKLASTHQKHIKRAKLKNFENKQNLK